MFFIVFGWNKVTKSVLGIFFNKTHCSHCNNDDCWKFTRIRKWFTLFFIPIIPYSNEYWTICPICGWGSKMNDKQVNQAKADAIFK